MKMRNVALTFYFSFYLFFIISVLVILVHQVKLNENEKCCLDFLYFILFQVTKMFV